jgi:hypothetical protein
VIPDTVQRHARLLARHGEPPKAWQFSRFDGHLRPRYTDKQEPTSMNQRTFTVKHVSLDREDQRIRDFARSFPVDPEGTLVELEGQAIFRVLPATSTEFDPVKLKAAILNRRDASRESNQEWEAADMIRQPFQQRV